MPGPTWISGTESTWPWAPAKSTLELFPCLFEKVQVAFAAAIGQERLASVKVGLS
jgi:hypothetical protein